MRKELLIAGLAAACLSPATAAPLPDAVPIEAFAELPFLEKPELSPDGTRIAAKVAVGNRQTFVITSVSGDDKAKVIGSTAVDINWWQWVNDDWLILGVGDQQLLYGHDLYVTRVLRVSADMKTVQILQPDMSGIDGDDLVWVARDGSARILLARQTGIDERTDFDPTVFDIDVSTGRSRVAVRSSPGVYQWDADAAGNVRLGYAFQGGEARRILYRGIDGERFDRIEVPRTANRKEWDFGMPLPQVFRTDGSSIAIDDRGDRSEVYELSLPNFALGKKLFGSSKYDVEGLFLNQAGNDVDGIAITEQRYRVEWLNPRLKEIQAGLDQTLGAGNGTIISWSRDRSRLLVQVGNPSQAGALYFWDTASATMQRIAWKNSALKGRKLSPVKTIEYKARDGTPIEAVLTLPRGREAKGLPLIVMPHGGPAARDSEEYDWWTQFLAEQGYAVIQPNYRGSTGYGAAFQRLGDGEWGLKMQDDLLDAIGWAASAGVADPNRVCIVGASYGGYAAMRGAQRDGNHYRCAVSFAGVSDIDAMRRYDKGFLTPKYAKSYWSRQVRDSTSVSPRFHASSFGAPILIAHGRDDKRVPIKQSRVMVEELKKAGKPHQYLEQPKGDHHFSRSEDRLNFLKALKGFLDKHNPA